MAKFGKKNVVKIDPTEYNVALMGESGIGKSGLMVEVLDKLVGEDGYMLANMGLEDGVDAIDGASYEDVPDFETLEELVEDIIENKEEDYPKLKVLCFDTWDELFRITEPHVIRLHNKENPEKKVKSIKQAFGGFMGGEDKAIDLVLEIIWRLKREAGVSIWFTGHTKRRTTTDVVTGEEYDTLTSNMSMRYFNAIKTKLHILGVASVSREIEKIKKKQVVGADKIIGKVKGESRIITFRDDNFNIDSKSRFANIVESIPLDADEFIKALNDAIAKARTKKVKPTKEVEEVVTEDNEAEEELKAKQLQEKKEKVEKAKENAKVINESKNEKLLIKIKEYVTSDDADGDILAEVSTLFKASGFKTSDTANVPTSVYEKAVALFE